MVASWATWASTFPKPSHRVVLTSLPKAGTNLVRKALEGMPGTRPAWTGLFGATAPAHRPGARAVPIGVDWPRLADADGVRARLRAMPPGTVVLAHAPHSSALSAIVGELDARVVAVVRDPRAVAASLVPFVLARPGHFLHPRFATLDAHGRLQASIVGLDPDEHGNGLLDVGVRLGSVAAWARESQALVLRFEDLIGPDGGGSLEQQHNALRALARHVGARVDDDLVGRLADGLFGGTSTFRRGAVDGWRDELTAQHLESVREVAGEVATELGYDLGP